MTKLKTDASLLQSCVSVSVTDLRIGNYYSYDDDAIKLDGSLLATYLQNDTDLYLYPILLTEQWLFKFGFIKYGKLHDSYKLNPFIVELGILGNHYTFRKIMNKDESMLLKEMKYVHELQDLYKDLKGYELQVSYLTEH